MAMAVLCSSVQRLTSQLAPLENARRLREKSNVTRLALMMFATTCSLAAGAALAEEARP